MSPPAESPTPFELVSPRSVALGRLRSVGIVGAGVAGLACATHLVTAGFRVRVFDKGRGPGGRISTRRAGSFHFDHGAQYFTVRDPAFAEQVDAWVAEGTVALWHGRIRVLDGGEIRGEKGTTARYVGVPRMSALARRLARHCRVHAGTRVGSLDRQGNQWVISNGDGVPLGRFDVVVVALPAPQAVALLVDSPRLEAQAETVSMEPTWAALVGFERPLDLPFDGAFVEGSSLSWVARDSSKPGRPGTEGWVLHGSHPWSRRHLEEEPQQVAETLVEALASACGREIPQPAYLTAHRWRYAAPEVPLARRYLLDAELGLAACGDWCGGPRVEGAYLSGRALAEALEGGWGGSTQTSA